MLILFNLFVCITCNRLCSQMNDDDDYLSKCQLNSTQVYRQKVAGWLKHIQYIKEIKLSK